MKRKFWILTMVCLGLSNGYALAQSDAGQQKEVVEQFFKLECGGGRISYQGWQEARRFFVHPSPYVSRPKVFVIGDSYKVWEPMKIGGKPTVAVEITPVGQLDSNLRFTAPARSYYKNSRYFKLALTEERSELGLKAEAPNDENLASRWLIDEPSDSLMLSISSAIRYVTDQGQNSTDPGVRKNADETLAKLKSLKSKS